MSDELRDHALSFGPVAEAYDRARPSYPAEAAAWLVGPKRSAVLELGAGTGKLTELLVAAGHDVVATDPLPEMLGKLRSRVPRARAAVATAERIPVASRSADVVVSAQAFHWFDHDVALAEIARVLRPGGVLALVWNARDPVVESAYFGPVEQQEFRFWQSLRRDDLFDLVRSRSYVALLDDAERDELLRRVGALYDDYGRGPDGMQLPYLTRCYRAVVQAAPPPRVPASAAPADDAPAPPVDDPGTLLIDFK
ncbi:MAG: class I SAM-dependent methyltransferase [Propionibacteriales bacterium]|nr:class I SAM-dependent methyltransferase [Propionibacteriales bacterium]